jgi:hypothetical protein
MDHTPGWGTEMEVEVAAARSSTGSDTTGVNPSASNRMV